MRDPFAGNIISPSEISQVGMNLLNLYPNPNGGLTATAGTYTSDPTTVNDTNQYTGRVDHRFDDNNSLYARVTHAHNNQLGTSGSLILGGGTGYLYPNISDFTQGVIGYTRLMGANKVNEVRFAVNRFGSDQLTAR